MTYNLQRKPSEGEMVRIVLCYKPVFHKYRFLLLDRVSKYPGLELIKGGFESRKGDMNLEDTAYREIAEETGFSKDSLDKQLIIVDVDTPVVDYVDDIHATNFVGVMRLPPPAIKVSNEHYSGKSGWYYFIETIDLLGKRDLNRRADLLMFPRIFFKSLDLGYL